MKKLLSYMGALAASVMLFSCVSSPYGVSQTLDAESLGGKTIFFEVGVAPRSLPLFPLLDAGIHNNEVRKIADRLDAIQTEKTVSMDEITQKRYALLYSPNLVILPCPISTEKLTWDYFTKTGTDISAQIAQICAENDADVAVAIVLQVTTDRVGYFGINADNQIRGTVCVFDKDGKIILQRMIITPLRKLAPKDFFGYGLLFDEGTEYINMVIAGIAL